MDEKNMSLLERIINGMINNNYMNTMSGSQFSSVGNVGMTPNLANFKGSDTEEELRRAMMFMMPPGNKPAMVNMPDRVQMLAAGLADFKGSDNTEELLNAMKQIKTKKKKRSKFKNFR